MARGGYRGNAYGAKNAYSYYAGPKTPYTPQPKAPLKAEPCVIFTRTGRCDQRKTCRYQHDANRTALCQQFLKSGRCAKAGGERCFLSHKPVPENTPMCKHFARGHCNNSNCQFTHMTNLGTDPNSAPVCRSFALNGWCDRGAKCTKRHCFDCPDFDAHGSCANPTCKLEHVIKAQTSLATVAETPKENTRETIDLNKFIEFLEHASRESFDAETKHTTSTARELSDEEPADTVDESESESESDQGPDWDEMIENASDNEVDVNADFIKV